MADKETLQKWLDNCELALLLWTERVKPEQVVPGLRDWVVTVPHCGTKACFGGYLATWPEFQDMGVTACEVTGQPEILRSNPKGGGLKVAMPSLLSYHLFGCRWIFQTAISEQRVGLDFGDNGLYEEELTAPDHKKVIDRLKYNIAKLKEALAEKAVTP